jgi:C1A family cysteine protease
MKNSWGRGWGIDGRASISFADMERLILDNGEACMAVQV